MEVQHNDDFKYVIQDVNCVYLGRELTYAEMMDREDIPFKWKAIISAHITKDTDLNTKMADHILTMESDQFSYRIFEQLKMTIRVCYKTQKKTFSGKVKDKWIHRGYPLKQFLCEYRQKVLSGTMLIEDITLSKLALMTISI